MLHFTRCAMASLVIAASLVASPALADEKEDLHKVSFIGTQKAITNPPSPCSFDKTKTCLTGTATAAVMGRLIGKGTQTVSFNIDLSDATPNGIGGLCFPLTATVITTAANGATFDFSAVGPDCATGSSDSGPRTGNLTFFISGGTRRFKNATGSGQVIVGDDGSGNQTVSGHGVLLLPE